jgi:hypothetical protein
VANDPVYDHDCSLGRLALSRQGLLRRNNLVYSTCEQVSWSVTAEIAIFNVQDNKPSSFAQATVPLVITMGGGYTKVTTLIPFSPNFTRRAN